MNCYWRKIDSLSHVPPDLLEFVILPARKMLEKEFLELPIGSTSYEKERLFLDFEIRSKELLRGTTYKFIAEVNQDILSINVLELFMDECL